MKPYPAYKASGVPWLGEVPAHWKKLRVANAFITGSGTTPPTDEPVWYEGTVPWVQTSELRESEVLETDKNLTEAAIAKFSALQVHKKGSVVVAMYGATIGRVGMLGVDAAVNQACCVLSPVSNVTSKFMFWWLQSMRTVLALMGTGGGQPNISQEKIAQLRLFSPEPDEQQAIATYLDTETARIDTLIAEKGRLIDTLREFSRSTFVGEFVTQAASGINAHPRIEWLPAIPSDWTYCKVKHIVESFDQGVSPQCEARPPEGDEWGVLKVGCVNTGLFDPQESKALPPELPTFDEITLREGDVMISRANTRNLVGRCAVADKAYPRLMLSDKVYRLRIDRKRCTPAFLVDLLALPLIRQRIEERATGASASMQNIDRRTILELDIVLPPLDIQLAIVQRIQVERQGISKLIDHVQDEIKLLQELRAATITDAVTGKIQVAQSNERAHKKEKA
jgi:type I restriction enzyme S subunit